MKNLLLLLCFILLGINALSSQHAVGVKAGPNLAYMDYEENNSILLWHAGIFGHFQIGRDFFIQPELLYNVKGSDQDKIVISPVTLKFQFEYLSMPFMFGYKLGDRFAIMAGPEMSKLVRSTIYFNERKSHEKFGIKDVDLAVNAGLAFNFTDRFGIDLRYSLGLVKAIDLYFTDINGQSLGGTDKRKNRVLQASLCYGFGLGAKEQ